MGKKRRSEKKQKVANTSHSRWKAVFSGILTLLGLVLAVWLLLPASSERREENLGKPSEQYYQLVETRPVLSASFFTGAVAEAYQVAKDMPEVIDQFYCYCQCKEYHGHKTLLTCFTDLHAADCDICLYQALTGAQMVKQGRSIDSIQKFFSARFAR